jgi:hypothetical protein
MASLHKDFIVITGGLAVFCFALPFNTKNLDPWGFGLSAFVWHYFAKIQSK